MKRDYSDRLFKVDEKTGMVEFNKDEAREFKPFRAIIFRDKGGQIKGDPDGRKKYFARKELYYVYMMCDPFTSYSHLNKTRRHQVALENTGLIAVEGWKPDKLVKEAMEYYISEYPNLSPTAKAFLNSKVAIDNLGEDIGLLNDFNQTLRERIQEARAIMMDDEALADDKQRAKNDLDTYTQQLKDNNKEVLAMTATLPDRMEALEKLRKKLAIEDTERATPVGGGALHRREVV